MSRYFVIVTCRNSQKDIQAALDSLRAQTVPPEYVIVIDDGSKDNTPAILKNLQSSWPSLHVITNPDLGYNIGRVVCNWNKAILYARENNLPKTDYHMISTDDTVYEKEYAEKVIHFMDKDPNLAIASGEYDFQANSVTPQGAGRFVRTEFFDTYHGIYPEKMGYESLVLHTCKQYGYTFAVLPTATFKHTRPLGTNHHFYEFGASMKTLGYHPLFVLERFIIYFLIGRPIGRIGAVYMLYHYLTYRPKSTGYDSMHDENARSYIRSTQLNSIKRIRAIRIFTGGQI